ncbi:FlhC family transcriptional regulator [Paraburkholderia sp. J8-2]|uniref:FlhC family transcriptional regulator n=1 Tax=Paraburkholderia sp. J8-2 TaxID=2805440 RepID=UPI002AB6A2A9|nr:FlhC family transcriptional regulator [Paraburkholderia sp. J8-2]
MSTEPNHVKSVDDYKAIERLYLPRWIAERIRAVNYDLVDHIWDNLKAHAGFNAIYRVEVKEIDHLRRNKNSMGVLLAAPFLMLSPSLPTVEDWRCFVDATPTTRAVDELRRKMPTDHTALTKQSIQHANRQFVDVIQAVANTSILSAPLLGMTSDLARYLGEMPGYKLRAALQRISDLPLFQWRFTTPAFWFEFTANDLNHDQVAHHIMSTTPFRAGELPHTANWADLRLGRETHEMYAAALMAHGCRASTAATLFRLPQSRTRQMYMEIHGKPSPCGNLPNSLQWFVERPQQRVHSTVFIWLYRSALNMGANTPQALIAAADLYNYLFRSGRALLATDRGYNLTRAMAADARLSIAPCRECGTHYIVSNNESKIEMRNSFTCPACSDTLVGRVRTPKGA